MRLHKQYLMLYRAFGDEGETEVKLSEVAEALDCTHRNAAIVLARMSEAGWIEWMPVRGRGRSSLLRMLADAEQVAREFVQKAVSRSDIGAAIDEIRMHAGSIDVQEHLDRWVLSRLGPHVETVNRKQVDTLRLPVRGTIHTFDPLAMNLLTESFIASHVFDTLVRIDERGQAVPHLAHAWETDESRTNWTFYLRKGVFFHSGKELDSEDVAFSLGRLLRSGNRTLYRTIFRQIASVEPIHRYIVKIQLARRHELFLPFLATVRASILPAGLSMLSEEKFGKQPDGTGPFRVIQLTDRMCLLEAYPAYFRERALLDRVEIWSMPGWHAEDESTFNVIHNPVRAADDKLWQQIDSPVSVIKFLTMNASKTGPLMNPENRRIVVNALRGGQNPDGLAVSSDQSLSTPFFRQPLILTTIQPYQHDAERVASMLGAHGIPVSIQLVTPDDFKGEARLQSDLILFSIIRDQDEQLRLFDLYHNMSDHLEPLAVTDVRTLLERVTKETDPHARNDLYLKLKSQLEQKHLLYILSERRSAAAVHRSIRGVRFNPQGWVDLRSLWFSTQPLKSSNE